MALTDTESAGRIDIIIFPNGGKEVIGRQAAYPSVPESAYLPEIQRFVAAHQGLSEPTKYTGRYSVKDGELSMVWMDWAGEIVREEEQDMDLPEMEPPLE